MRQENPSSTQKEDAGDKLITAGAYSYVEALVALADFRGQVQDRCKAVMCACLKELGHALGREFSENDVWVWPGKPTDSISTMWPLLYSALTLSEKLSFDLGLYWEYIDNEKVTLFAFGALEIYDEALRTRALKVFEKSLGVGLVKKYYVSVRDAVPEAAPLTFQEKLGTIASRWIRELERTRGLAGLVPTSSNRGATRVKSS